MWWWWPGGVGPSAIHMLFDRKKNYDRVVATSLRSLLHFKRREARRRRRDTISVKGPSNKYLFPLTGEWHRSMPFRTFFEKKVEFHRNSKNEVMRIPRMCSTHKTDFKTSNFYNKIPSRIQIRVA